MPKIALKPNKCQKLLKVAKKLLQRAKIGPNGVLSDFMDVFAIPMTKKCTKTNICATGSVKD
jgi:hypothetical protein